MSSAGLFEGTPVVVDGGLSTQLEVLGHDVSGGLWTARVLLEDPGVITRAHIDYVEAGADVVITASYQVSRAGFEEAGLTADAADAALIASIDAARFAVDGSSAKVAASVGPYGAILHDGSEYRGNYGLSRTWLADFHAERIDILLGGTPDLLAVETIPDVREAEALADVLAAAGGPAAWVCFSARDGEHLRAGQSIEEAVSVAAGIAGVQAVGINCTDPRYVTELVGRIRATVDLPIIVYPNAGGAWDAGDGQWRGGGGGLGVGLVGQWLAAGATAIGGCCGTDAAVVRRIGVALGRTGT